jgi:O-antigen ligase
MLIKYFPEIGRGFDTWSGRAINMGVTINKNELGFLCFVLAYFLFWQLVGLRNQPRSRNRTQQFILVGGFLALTGWLLVMAKSSTAFAALAVGIGTMLLLGLRIVNKRRFALWVVGIVLVAVVAEYSFGVYRFVIEDVFGKNVTLTDRTEVWKDVLAVDINPILGAGFESFWLGGRLDILWGKWAFRPNQAHNGYIEIYVTLGWVGVTLFIAMILGTFRKAQVTLVRNFEIGRFRMGFLFAVLAYNYTEATFKALHIIWFVFYLAAMDYATRRARVPARQQFGRAVGGSAGAQEASAFDAAGSRLSPVR